MKLTEKIHERCSVLDGYTGFYTEEERIELIKKELNRLKKSIKHIDENKKKVLIKLFDDAAFITVTLEETRKIIARDGIIEPYQNGANQKGLKKSSAVEVYDKMLNTYLKVIEQINKVMPEGEKINPAEEINEFIKNGKK